MKKFCLFISMIVLACLLYQCTHEPNEIPEPARDTTKTSAVTCDTAVVTFSGTVYPIIQRNCLTCHSQSHSVQLKTYANLKTLADLGLLYCVISHSPGCKPMPDNGTKLSNCNIRQIKLWIDAGAPNN
jgi:hypothetical protein